MFTGVEKQGVEGSLARPNLNVTQALNVAQALKPVLGAKLQPQASSLRYVGWAFDG
jgi:hypothetical protein